MVVKNKPLWPVAGREFERGQFVFTTGFSWDESEGLNRPLSASVLPVQSRWINACSIAVIVAKRGTTHAGSMAQSSQVTNICLVVNSYPIF